MSTTTRASVRLVSEGVWLVQFPDELKDTAVYQYRSGAWRCEKHGLQPLGATRDCVHIAAVKGMP